MVRVHGHYISPTCGGEICGMCYRVFSTTVAATHKVGEEFPTMDQTEDFPMRHNLTQYVCCQCFGNIMGPLAEQWCRAGFKG